MFTPWAIACYFISQAAISDYYDESVRKNLAAINTCYTVL